MIRLLMGKRTDAGHAFGDEFERCVVCGAETPFRRSTPVELRTEYIQGTGQLCRRCAAEFRNEEQYARENGYAYEIPYYVKIEEL